MRELHVLIEPIAEAPFVVKFKTVKNIDYPEFEEKCLKMVEDKYNIDHTDTISVVDLVWIYQI